jgi:preprotein translocase subunit SecG
MFGPKTNTFLTRTTTILSIVFFLTCLSLALISARQSRSLMRSVKPSEPVKQPSPSATENQAQPLQEVKPAQAQENSPTQQAAPAAEKQPQQAPAAEEKTSPK